LKNTLLIAFQSSLAYLRQAVRHHPRGFSVAAFSLLLLGGGAYALAAAVVTLAPDVSKLPVREVIGSVAPLPLQPQSQALDTHRYTLYRSDVTRSSDTAESLLHRLGIDDPDAARFLRRETLAHRWLLGRGGRNLTAEASDDNKLIKLVARWSQADDGHFSRLVIEKTAEGFASRLEAPLLTASTRIASGTIESSLFASTDEAQIPDSVAIQLAEIFSGDIDFHRELRKGDRYAVVYEVLEGDGEPLRAGRVLSAEFVNAGKTYQAVWYQEPAFPDELPIEDGRPTYARGHSGYYTLEGQSLRRVFLASPLAFSRITSGFKMRFHPIRKKWIRHLGVDYAAPTGTPVRSVGDGVVQFAGVQNGYGNVVFIRHNNNYVTVYAHLSRIYVRRGQRVEQAQRIAATGATGWATGPHLHFEYRVNGQYQNPLTISRKSETRPLPAAARPVFARLAAIARQELGAAPLLQAAR
jgi:murein DD-endopeptidase MepM/ murein hydrolase activator NlpD